MKEDAINEYIKAKHNQDECIGFIDGYEACEKRIKELEKECKERVETLNRGIEELQTKLNVSLALEEQLKK